MGVFVLQGGASLGMSWEGLRVSVLLLAGVFLLSLHGGCRPT